MEKVAKSNPRKAQTRLFNSPLFCRHSDACTLVCVSFSLLRGVCLKKLTTNSWEHDLIRKLSSSWPEIQRYSFMIHNMYFSFVNFTSNSYCWQSLGLCLRQLFIAMGHVNKIPAMQFFTGIFRNTQSKSYTLSLTECVWDFKNNGLWDTH